MNLRLPSLDPVSLSNWWPKADRVLEKRARRGISMTAEGYKEAARKAEHLTPALRHSPWGFGE